MILPLSHRNGSSQSSWSETLKTDSLTVEEALSYQRRTPLTVQANYFTQAIIWKHVASSFWCVFSPFQSTVRHFIIQPFGVSVGLHGPSIDRWGTSIHQGREEERGNAEKQEKLMKQRREGRAWERDRKKTQRQSGRTEERWWFYDYRSPLCCMYNWKMKSVLSLCLDAQSHT